MQTKRKRKQWALLAFTMIATFMLQIVTPLTVSAEEEEERILSFDYSSMLVKTDNSEAQMYNSTVTVKGNGNFVVKTFTYDDEHLKDFGGAFYICSDKEFMHTLTSNGTSYGGYSNALLKDGVYHVYYTFASASKNDFTYNYTGYVNNTHFESREAYYKALEEYTANVDVSKDNYKEIAFDNSTAVYDTNIPTPNITVKSDYTFGFNNDSEGYYFQLKGRWYSVDDIELYKKNLQWLYKYESVIKSNLTDWVTTSEKASTSMQDLNFATFGKSAFDSFLSYYPIENRSYTGGTNAIGNYFNGYNDALSQIKMLLSQPTTFYNGLEIYIRYYTFDKNGIAHYGKWCHYYDDLANQGGSNGVIDDYIHNDDKDLHNGYQSEFGVTDDGLSELENSTNSKNDIDIKPEEDNRYDNQIVGIEDLDLSNLISSLGSLKSQSTALINMFVSVFSFLPSWLITLIACSFGLCCVLGVWKLVRG